MGTGPARTSTDRVALTARECTAVLAVIDRQKLRCPGCGHADFVVGSALPLGFLFLSEGADSFMIALTCRTPGCPRPRTGIRLDGVEFRVSE